MIFSRQDMLRVAEILAEAARAEIMPRFRNLPEGGIRAKSSAIDLVTDADEAAERRITADLLAAFPRAVVVGEEAASKDRRVLDAIADAELCFIVDPIDGTKNFASGLTLFGVMAAVVSRGETIAGIIHDPIGHDWALALRGEGAWFQRPDGSTRTMRVADPAPLSRMEGAVGVTFLPEPLRTTVGGNLAKMAAMANYRCAAHEYRVIASGALHLALYSKLEPWDHAAGWLLHREAGGYSARFDGSPYLPTHRSGGLLLAPDETSWREARDGLLNR